MVVGIKNYEPQLVNTGFPAIHVEGLRCFSILPEVLLHVGNENNSETYEQSKQQHKGRRNNTLYSIDILKLSQFFLCLAMFFFFMFLAVSLDVLGHSAVVFGRQSRWVLSSLPRRSGAEVTEVTGYNEKTTSAEVTLWFSEEIPSKSFQV